VPGIGDNRFREYFMLVPLRRIRRQFSVRKLSCNFLKGRLVFVQIIIHAVVITCQRVLSVPECISQTVDNI